MVPKGDEDAPSWRNVTYTVDICAPLRRSGKVDKKEECPHGTRVCAIEHVIDKEDPTIDKITKAYPIAGELKGEKGKDLDAKWERLKTGDDGREGVRVEMRGGFKTDKDGENKKYQKAVIKFICDKTRDGTEYNWIPEDKYDGGKEKREAEEEETDPEEDDKKPSLTYKGYNTDDDVDVLRLEWRTRYACEDYKSEKDAERRAHWGFFTWFIIIAFLSTATYLIFGSWLNYNRYGARGWDLLPHGDAIRDIPYLMKDWIRRVVNTAQGGGSRGGYAAV